MKVNVVKDGSVIKTFDVWRDGEKRDEPEKSFSYQLLEILRQRSEKIDIRDVRELLELGADPNFKIMVHTDEDQLNRQIDQYIDNDIAGMPKMRVSVHSNIAFAIHMQDSRPDIMEAMLKHKVDPNLDLSDVPLAKGPTTFYSAATHKADNIETYKRILDKLIKDGAVINVVDSSGDNVIHKCVSNGNYELIPYLIEIGVDPFLKNKAGKTPYDILDSQFYGLSGEPREDSPKVKSGKEMVRPLLKPQEAPAPQKKKSIFSSLL